jgi:hypothetical protein
LDIHLFSGALFHFGLAIICALALLVDLPPVTGVHPALKPLKFAISVGLFLGTLAVLLPQVSMQPRAQMFFSWLFLATMLLEMGAIVYQSVRGTTSHFNTATSSDSRIWFLMMGAIVVATLGMFALALAATLSPLKPVAPWPASSMMTWAWRLGLWLLLLAAVSGFSMGGRLAHSVGGADGGPGMAFTNWSKSHGDLRVSHFFALHALQTLPLAAWTIQQMPLGSLLQWLLFSAVVVVQFWSILWTLARAFAGLPLI